MIVLDTHAWIWWVTGDRRLPARAKASLSSSKRIGVPAICVWEVGMLVTRERLQLRVTLETWVELALHVPGVELLALTPAISIRASQLGAPPADPADRLIAATALVCGAPLVTRDERLQGLEGLATVW